MTLLRLILSLLILETAPLFSAGLTEAESGAVDYEQPKLLTGSVYETGADTNKILFRFKRTSARSGQTVRVLREFDSPDGSTAARERVVYEAGKLVSFALEDLRAGANASVVVRPDPKAAGKEQICFECRTGGTNDTKKTNIERLQKDTLMSDMIAPFILSHWDALMRGSVIRFRFIALARAETVGFKLIRESETSWHGKAAIRVRMEPTSVIIAQLIDPLFFTIEKDEPHRIFQYTGRTTPQIRRGDKWKDLDATTVFDWGQ